MAFVYNFMNFTIEDEERGLVVTQIGGPGHGIYEGLMKSDTWEFRFIVRRDSDRYPPPLFPEGTPPDEWIAWMKLHQNSDYHVRLQLSLDPEIGVWDRPETRRELAMEAAIAREVDFYKTEAWRVITN